MKALRFLLPFVLCIAFAAVTVYCAYRYADVLFECDGSFDAAISTVVTENAQMVYPWYAVESGEAVAIAPQRYNTDMLIRLITGYEEYVIKTGSFYFSEKLHMFFAEDVRLSDGSVADMAYYFENGAYSLSYLKLYSPCDSSDELLESERLRLLDMLGGASDDAYDEENQNPFATLSGYAFRSLDNMRQGFTPLSEQAVYALYKAINGSLSHLQSYCRGGLVWFDFSYGGIRFALAYDPTVAQIVSLSIKEG